MNDLREQLHAATPNAPLPDVDDLWSRGRRASRRRSASIGGGLLGVIIVASVAIGQLSDEEGSNPLDSIDSVEIQDDLPVDDVEIQNDLLVVDVPVGARVTLYPLDLPEGWTVTIEPFDEYVAARDATIELAQINGDERISIDLRFNIRLPEGPFEWGPFNRDSASNDVVVGFRGLGFEGELRYSGSTDTAAVVADNVTALLGEDIVLGPDFSLPGSWEVVVDTRSAIAGSTIRAVSPGGVHEIEMRTELADSTSRHYAALPARLAAAVEPGLFIDDRTAGRTDDGIIHQIDGIFFEITWVGDVINAGVQTFLDSLVPVEGREIVPQPIVLPAVKPEVSVPTGAPLGLYPLALGDDWEVTVDAVDLFGFFSSGTVIGLGIPVPGPLETVVLQVVFEPGPGGDLRWTEAFGSWEGRGLSGTIFQVPDQIDGLALLAEIIETGLVDAPTAPIPADWSVVADSRSVIGTANLRAVSPSGRSISMTISSIEPTHPTYGYYQRLVSERPLEGAFVVQLGSDTIAIPRFDSLFFYDGLFYQIGGGPIDGELREFINALRPVTAVEAS